MNNTKDFPILDDLPQDFDPMEMAAFLDGEANTKLVRGLTESPALRTVAAAGLDTGLVTDVKAAEALAARAAPLAARSAAIEGAGSRGLLRWVSDWLGTDWRAATAGVVLGVFGFGAGLAGGLGLGETGLSADDILVSASLSDILRLDTDTQAADPLGSNAFEAVFGGIE